MRVGSIKVLPLSMALPGDCVRLTAIKTGHGLQQRLADMGLLPGSEVRVLQSHPSGPILIEVKGSRLVIGHGMSSKILVEVVQNAR